MPQQKLAQVRELQYGEISRQRSLHTLLANDAQSNIGCLDHRNIIAAVAYASYPLTSESFEVLSDERFLSRGTSADADGFTEHGRCEKSLF
jgi:hypothetical protein